MTSYVGDACRDDDSACRSATWCLANDGESVDIGNSSLSIDSVCRDYAKLQLPCRNGRLKGYKRALVSEGASIRRYSDVITEVRVFNLAGTFSVGEATCAERAAATADHE